MTYKTIEAVAEALSIALAERGRATEELATIAIAAYQQAVASEAVGKQYRYKMPDRWSIWYPSASDLPRVTHLETETRDVFAAPPTPAGWKLVPLEPTDQMIAAGITRANIDQSAYGSAVYSAASIYRTMLSEAPIPETTI